MADRTQTRSIRLAALGMVMAVTAAGVTGGVTGIDARGVAGVDPAVDPAVAGGDAQEALLLPGLDIRWQSIDAGGGVSAPDVSSRNFSATISAIWPTSATPKPDASVRSISAVPGPRH